MSKKELQNCWRFLKCPKNIREDCAVYQTDSGKECWLLTNIEKGCPAAEKYSGCLNCPWYEKINEKG